MLQLLKNRISIHLKTLKQLVVKHLNYVIILELAQSEKQKKLI